MNHLPTFSIHVILILTLLIVGCRVQPSVVVPVPLTPDIEESKIYNVTAGGEKIYVGHEVSNDSAFEIASVMMQGKVSIKVQADEEIESFSIHPISKNIEAKKRGKTLEFTISEPLKLMVKINGNTPLLLFCTPPEEIIPDTTSANVLYFSPGIHNVGRLRVKSNQTIYIAGGAKVYGTIEGYEVENVIIKGRGYLDGSKHTTWDERIFGIYFDRSKNIKIEGISIRNSYWWVTHFLLCENVEISHINLFSFYRNNGGMMLDGCNGYSLTHSAIFTNDDCICPHALNAAGNGEPAAKDYLFENLVLYNVMTGNAIRIGASFETSQVLNWTFKDIDVLRHENLAALYSDHSDWAKVQNLKFINFYDEQEHNSTIEFFIDSTNYSCFTGYKNERGSMDQVYFINLQSPGGKIVLHGYDEEHQIKNVHFYNCEIGGEKIDSKQDLLTNKFVSNLYFHQDSITIPEPKIDPFKEVKVTQPQELIIDNTDAAFQAIGFEYEENTSGAINSDYHHTSPPEGFSNFKAAIYTPQIAGNYSIYIYWDEFENKATNTRWVVHHQEGYTTKYFDQNHSKGWHHHGDYQLTGDSHVRLLLPGYFEVTNGDVVADAVKFVRQP